jgi:hypothetical protein
MARSTLDPWVATDAAVDPLRHALRLAHAHESARSGARVGSAVRAVVDRSWRRSAAAGVDPSTARVGPLLDAESLAVRRSEHPLVAVRSTLTRVLRDLAASAPHVFAISDEHGVLLWVDGPQGVVERASDEMAFEVGADWSERTAGTNAVGTALAENHAVQIFSAEHFRPSVHGWTCSGAPIHDPETGRVIGALDATADLRTVSPRTLPIVQAAARAAEITLRARATERDVRLRQRALHRPAGAPRPEFALSASGRVLRLDGAGPTVPAGPGDGHWRLPLPDAAGGEVLLPDGRTGHAEPCGGDGFLVYATETTGRSTPATALELLGTGNPTVTVSGVSRVISRGQADLLGLLADAPDGLRAEQLAVLLHGDDAHPGTARAACSRLRSRLPGVLLADPYRLADGVRTDLELVRSALRAGDLLRAVGAYRGPLLPASTAPGVRRVADDLHAELRGALLEARPVGALEVWCAAPHGRDDLPAAEALVRALPPGDPRRGAAQGRVRTLRRRLGL